MYNSKTYLSSNRLLSSNKDLRRYSLSILENVLMINLILEFLTLAFP
jgi:hypothetical protein